MTVTKVKLLHSEGGEDANGVNYALTYLVVTNDRLDGPYTVRNAVGWTYGDPYVNGNDSDARAIASKIAERPVSSAHYNDWHVTVSFENLPNVDLSNPLNDAIEQTITWQGVTRRIYYDTDNKWVANTADDLYQNGIEAEDNTPALSYRLTKLPFQLH